jgi:F-type H+-transporting ATPase subunit gamma
MQMVAAAKLRRARERTENALPYATKMHQMLVNLHSSVEDKTTLPLLYGNGKKNIILLVVATSDRGLCGAFNSSIIRAAKKRAKEIVDHGKQLQILCIGKKSYEQFKSNAFGSVVNHFTFEGKKQPEYSDAERIADAILELFKQEKFDQCEVIYNKFKSVISQIVTTKHLIPIDVSELEDDTTSYEYEPDQQQILAELLPLNVAVQIYHILLENAASEQGARMAAMDNATKSAGDLIQDLTLLYNRTRQAVITKELIEIISGAEAV